MQRKNVNHGPNFAEGGSPNGANTDRPTESGVHKDDWSWLTGYGAQDATEEMGAIIGLQKYGQTREGLNGLMDSLGDRAAGGASISDVMAQQRLDDQLEAQMSGGAGPGTAGAAQMGVMARPLVGNASGAAEQRAGDQSSAQQLLASTATDARARELSLSQAQHRQLLMHKAMNIGLDLNRLQAMQNLASGGAQGLASLTQFGLGSIKPAEYQGQYQNDYYGNRGGASDLGLYDHGYDDSPGSDPSEWNSWGDPGGTDGGGYGDYGTPDMDAPQFAAEGGVIGEDDERKRARKFLAAMSGA